MMAEPTNCVTKIAAADGRDYITPEDVEEALKANDVSQVRLDVLQVIGSRAGFGVEDISLCAFVAWNGKT